MAKHSNNAFLFVIVTVALDMMGFGIIVPVLPSLLEEVMQLPPEDAVSYGGYLTAVYAVANFVATPTLGNLSDRYGRRPVLLASIGTLAVDFLIMGFASSFALLVVGRVLTGVSSATFATANAYIADVTEPEARGRAFGMLGAAFGVGFIIGPALGAAFSTFGPRAPFFAAAAIAGLNFLYGLFVLPESLAEADRRPFDWRRANPFGAFLHFRKLPGVRWFLVATGIYGFAHTVYPSTWSFHGRIRYDWADWEIGLSLALVGIGSAVIQTGLIGPVMKRIGAARTALFGMAANIAAMVGYAFAYEGWMALAVIPLSSLGGFTSPALNTLISNVTPSNAQGELHGANASLGALGMMLSPLVMTQTLHAFSVPQAPVYFPGAAFLLAAALSVVAVPPFLWAMRTTPSTDAA